MNEKDRTDELIAQVFASLQDVESPTGMEQRVLDTLEARTAGSVRGKWIGRARAWRDGIGLRGWTVFTMIGILMAFLLVTESLLLTRSLLLTKSTTHPFSHALQQAPSVAAVAYKPPTLAFGQQQQEGRGGGRRPALRHVVLRSNEGTHPKQDLAAQEASAPSMPSPPMPLTKGERLLQQAARRGRPEADSPLNPEVRARERLQAAMEFTDFFTPPAKTGTE